MIVRHQPIQLSPQQQIDESVIWLLIILIIVGIAKIICFFIKKIYYFFIRVLNTSNKNYNSSNYSSNNSYINKFSNKYEYRHLDQLILHTKSCVRLPRGNYKPFENMYNYFLQNPYDTDVINGLAKDILKHCDYKGKIPYVSYTVLWDELSKNYLEYDNIRITINTKVKRPPEELIGILIHECMNILIYNLKIDYPEGSKETAADVMAVYMGFYDYMIKGYSKIGWTRKLEFNYIYREIEEYKRR